MTADWLKDFGKAPIKDEPLIMFVLCECGDTLAIPRGAKLTDVEGWRDCGMRGRSTRTVHKARLYDFELANEINHNP